ncbi:MAG: hypothetical protein CMJ19_15125 [Phycisphaeraceae bacterium]|nr:hypothetical protein [Phycisphaeraceae bacterium]
MIFDRPYLIEDSTRSQRRAMKLSVSEIMVIAIVVQTSNYRTFKHFYSYLQRLQRHDFPNLINYPRFVRCLARVTMPLFTYLVSTCPGPVTGISFIDSTAIKISGNKRINRHRVLDGIVARGQSTMGWFYGFK